MTNVIPAMIVFENVTKAYSVGNPALQDVSFTVKKGDFVLIKGKSGAGKTTIAKLLTKELEPTQGSITFEGDDLSLIPISKLHFHRRRIGVVYQDYKLLPDLSVRENIALALEIMGKDKEEIENRINDLLSLVHIDHKAEFFPAQLSGGETQRVSIARALANAPDVLFADEPTGNLDEETGRHIIQILKKINSIGTTVLISSHVHCDLANHLHRTFLIESGKLTELSDEVELQENAQKTPQKAEKKASRSSGEEKATESKKDA